ncbi:MAG: lectin-like protein, partial [Candidatus Limivivens sp.]|nr:lectin-like protein [Candidatus Limivivens sp.]
MKQGVQSVSKMLLLVLLLAAAWIWPGAGAEAAAPADAQEWCGHYYKVFYEKDVSLSEANALCQAMGGYLVTCTSEEEWHFVQNLMNNYYKKGGSRKFWLGCRESNYDGNYEWMNGEEYLPPYRFFQQLSSDGYWTVENGTRVWKSVDSGAFPRYFSYGFTNDGSPSDYWKFGHHVCSGENAMKATAGYVCEWGDRIDVESSGFEVTLSQDSYVADSTARRPSVKATYNGIHVLEEDHDYSVEYVNNVYAGEAQVIITGRGRFTGTAVRTFQITPQQVKNVSAVRDANGRTFSVTWDKTADATGYSVRYVKNSDSSETLFEGMEEEHYQTEALQRNQSYTLQVQAYKEITSGGKSVYLCGPWSDACVLRTGSTLATCDFWGFPNEKLQFEYKDFRKMFEPLSASLLYDGLGKGREISVCYGMALAALSSLQYGNPAETSFSGSSLNNEAVGMQYKISSL